MGQRTDTAKLNWLVYNVWSYGVIAHLLSDRACVAWFDYRIGYLETDFRLDWIKSSSLTDKNPTSFPLIVFD